MISIEKYFQTHNVVKTIVIFSVSSHILLVVSTSDDHFYTGIDAEEDAEEDGEWSMLGDVWGKVLVLYLWGKNWGVTLSINKTMLSALKNLIA